MEGLPYSEWLRRKDAEDRMKKKLIQEAKKDIRQEVVQLAQQDQMDREVRQKIMEDWVQS